jgi:WD40 repeat protein
VTCVCFDASSAVLYSSDSEGAVLSWHQGGGGHDWRLQREFLVGELRGVAINALAVHPNGKRIYVYARDSVVRMLDVLTGVLLQNYLGALAHKYVEFLTNCFKNVFFLNLGFKVDFV